MLASRAARPSLKAASSLVSKVEPDLTLQSELREIRSQWDSEELKSWRRWFTAEEPTAGSEVSTSLSAGSVWVCVRFTSPRDIRYWVIRSDWGSAGSRLCWESVTAGWLDGSLLWILEDKTETLTYEVFKSSLNGCFNSTLTCSDSGFPQVFFGRVRPTHSFLSRSPLTSPLWSPALQKHTLNM